MTSGAGSRQRVHALILGRRLPGDRRSLLSTSDFQGASGQNRYIVFGAYDSLLHRVLEDSSQEGQGFSAAREDYDKELLSGFDIRLIAGLELSQAWLEERGYVLPHTSHASPEVEDATLPLLSMTFVRLNEGFLRPDRRRRLMAAFAYVRELVDVMKCAASSRVLVGAGLLDFVILQWGTQYTKMVEPVRLLRSTTLQHFTEWSDERLSRDTTWATTTTVGDVAQYNHLVAMTHTIFGFRASELDKPPDYADLAPPSVAHSRPDGRGSVPVPFFFFSFYPGHEQARDQVKPILESVRAEKQPFMDREAVGNFERVVVPFNPLQPITEEAAIKQAIAFYRRFFEQEQVQIGGGLHHFYRTQAQWTLPVPEDDHAITPSLRPGSLIEKIFQKRGLLHGEHAHLIDAKTFEVESLDGLSTPSPDTRPFDDNTEMVLKGLNQIYKYYNVLVHSDFLLPVLDDLHSFLKAMRQALVDRLAQISRRPGARVAELAKLHKVTERLSDCITQRLNFTTFSSKVDLAFYDASALHKMLRGFTGAIQIILRGIDEHLKWKVHVFLYLGALGTMEIHPLLDSESGRFFVIQIPSSSLFEPSDLMMVVHEVAHNIFFRSFDADGWVEAFMRSVALSVRARLLRRQDARWTEQSADYARSMVLPVLKYVYLKHAAEAVNSQQGILQWLVPRWKAHVREATIMSALKHLLAEHLGDLPEVDLCACLETFLQHVTWALDFCSRLFKEVFADFLASKIVGEEAYAANMDRTKSRFSMTGEELLDIRLSLLRTLKSVKTGADELGDDFDNYRPLLGVLASIFQPFEEPLRRIRATLDIPEDGGASLSTTSWFGKVMGYAEALDGVSGNDRVTRYIRVGG